MPLHFPAHNTNKPLQGVLTLCRSGLLLISSLLLVGCSQPTSEIPAADNSPEPIIESTSTPEADQFSGEDDGTIFLAIEE
ncbi:MAG: hypothetical protein JNM02_12230, partial [Anaerolineales bacterium]|nr:hypothetical protein [Anaerolineales bacterium]